MTGPRRSVLLWLAVGAAGFLLVPWYALQGSVFALGWVPHAATKEAAPALLQVFLHGKWWLGPLGALLVAGTALAVLAMDRRARANALIAVGAAGFLYLLLQGFAIGPTGWYFESLAATLPALPRGQFGMGLGAALVVTAFGMLFALGLAGRGYFKGDPFVAASVITVAALVAVFTFFPVVRILISALQDNVGAFSLVALPEREKERDVKVHRVKETDVPAAPALEEYEEH